MTESMDIARIEAFIYREADLLDTMCLEEWLTLFSSDGVYWVPIADGQPHTASASILYDDAISREERVYHYLNLTFPSQNPRSRTLHCVSNVRVAGREDTLVCVKSNQVIYEMRSGDHTQIGLGALSIHVASVEFRLRIDEDIKIQSKKVLLLNRNAALGNLTFML